ncbi:acetylornithine deacetylase [Oceanicola granulosus HTCC2516]|uniref:Acetylornithine deacetylase n=1 Tax=Oceanicola granulosus (strain ATCC BAA-861 / DSM 15982 / KCTC 12143 / HTCC2516) TaxID=314256 RepID=Q2CB37_OCEGH|nr:acetylornithine deacetylase [Oceanicola granulosus]EAR49893.1 acetylornithine deacetylase [Oceanicola granulosus HTCC2516]
MTDLSQTLEHLDRLIAEPTVSSDSNLALIDDIAGRLEALGARVEILHDATGTKANLWATFGPDAPGGIVLSGHTDVVPVTDQDWTTDPFRLTEKDGLWLGRGTCDMKGFIAACLAMAPAFAERATGRPLHFAFTYDEEVGCLGGAALVEALKARELRPEMAIIGEPTSMRIIEGHKGCCEYKTRFTGCEGHGSRPDMGVNAVDYAVRYATRLQALAQQLTKRAPEGSRFEPPWTTINLGRLTGGHAHNVIPGKALMEWDMRPVTAEDADFVREDLAEYVALTLLPAMRAVDPRADITVEAVGDVVGLEPMEVNAARDLVAELTGANGTDLVSFGTEAGLFQSMGMSAVVCGPGSIEQAHKPDEYIAPDQLAECLTFLERLSHRLA